MVEKRIFGSGSNYRTGICGAGLVAALVVAATSIAWAESTRHSSSNTLRKDTRAESGHQENSTGQRTAAADSTPVHRSRDGLRNSDRSKAHSPGPWGYDGRKGPDHWGELSSKYHLCKSGQMQSPIDISGTSGATSQRIEFDYSLTPLNIHHNGHTVQVDYAPGSSISVGGKRYELKQFHVHTPSEHAVAGRRAAMEVHFVHQGDDGQLAVVGVLMDVRKKNLAFSEILQYLPTRSGNKNSKKSVLVNARDLLPRDTSHYRYMGSLTTPPCSEGVVWLVLKNHVSLSEQQLRAVSRAIGMNARPAQVLNNRLLLGPVKAN